MSLRGTIWEKPREERDDFVRSAIGDKLRDFEVFTKGPSEHPLAIAGQIAVNTLTRKNEYRAKAAQSGSRWEMEAYNKLADNVSMAGEAINLVTEPVGVVKGNEIVSGAMDATRKAGGSLVRKIGEVGDGIAERKRKTRWHNWSLERQHEAESRSDVKQLQKENHTL